MAKEDENSSLPPQISLETQLNDIQQALTCLQEQETTLVQQEELLKQQLAKLQAQYIENRAGQASLSNKKRDIQNQLNQLEKLQKQERISLETRAQLATDSIILGKSKDEYSIAIGQILNLAAIDPLLTPQWHRIVVDDLAASAKRISGTHIRIGPPAEGENCRLVIGKDSTYTALYYLRPKTKESKEVNAVAEILAKNNIITDKHVIGVTTSIDHERALSTTNFVVFHKSGVDERCLTPYYLNGVSSKLPTVISRITSIVKNEKIHPPTTSADYTSSNSCVLTKGIPTSIR